MFHGSFSLPRNTHAYAHTLHPFPHKVYLVIMSLLLELQLRGGLGDRLTATAFTLLHVGRQMYILHLQTTGQGLDLCYLEERESF